MNRRISVLLCPWSNAALLCCAVLCCVQGWPYQPRSLEKHADSILGWVSLLSVNTNVSALNGHLTS